MNKSTSTGRVAIGIFAVLLMLLIMVASNPDILCGGYNPTYSLVPPSYFDDETDDAEILWQSEIEGGEGYSPTQVNTVSITDTQVLVQKVGTAHRCNRTEFVAFDLETGEIAWSREKGQSFGAGFLYTLNSFQNAYYVVYRNNIRKLDSSGNLVWNTSYSPQADRTFLNFQNETLFYVDKPADEVLRLSQETGQIIERIEVDNLLDYWVDYALVKSAENQMTIYDLENQTYISNIFVSRVYDSPGSRPRTIRFDDLLLVVDSTIGVDQMTAYDIHTGEDLWTVNDTIFMYPIATDNRLIVHNMDGLVIYSLTDGSVLNRFVLSDEFGTPADTNFGEPANEEAISMAASDDTVVVHYRDRGRIVALRLP